MISCGVIRRISTLYGHENYLITHGTRDHNHVGHSHHRKMEKSAQYTSQFIRAVTGIAKSGLLRCRNGESEYNRSSETVWFRGSLVKRIWIKTKDESYGWVLPLWVHQCQELKTSTSMPRHALPPLIESSFSTRPAGSRTTSTRYCVRYSIIFTS